MRILFVHPNYRSGGAEIAGSWPPAWVAFFTGSLRRVGFDDIHFIDAMTNDISDDDLGQQIAELQPDVGGVTAITPSIYKAEEVLRQAQKHVPDALRMLGGVHPTFMYKQVLSEVPRDDGLMPEAPAARVHQALRLIEPEMAPALAWAAGERTARYILAHRIPKPAQRMLRLLPGPLAAPLLSKAIAKHAWTFAGSGRFSVVDPLTFEIEDNPIVRGEHSHYPLCHWHVAVFETLFATLVDPNLRCEETACCAMGAPACRFEVQHSRGGPNFFKKFAASGGDI